MLPENFPSVPGSLPGHRTSSHHSSSGSLGWLQVLSGFLFDDLDDFEGSSQSVCGMASVGIHLLFPYDETEGQMPCSHIKGWHSQREVPVGAGIESLAVASVRRLAVKPP